MILILVTVTPNNVDIATNKLRLKSESRRPFNKRYQLTPNDTLDEPLQNSTSTVEVSHATSYSFTSFVSEEAEQLEVVEGAAEVEGTACQDLRSRRNHQDHRW